MEGELLWFNEVRQDGMIRTDDGGEISVLGRAFPNGRGPVGRCGGMRVRFDRVTAAEGAKAVSVSYVPAELPRRARRRGRR